MKFKRIIDLGGGMAPFEVRMTIDKSKWKIEVESYVRIYTCDSKTSTIHHVLDAFDGRNLEEENWVVKYHPEYATWKVYEGAYMPGKGSPIYRFGEWYENPPADFRKFVRFLHDLAFVYTPDMRVCPEY